MGTMNRNSFVVGTAEVSMLGSPAQLIKKQNSTTLSNTEIVAILLFLFSDLHFSFSSVAPCFCCFPVFFLFFFLF